MIEYRRLPYSHVWHFHPRCQRWPRTLDWRGEIRRDVQVDYEIPSGDSVCQICQRLAYRYPVPLVFHKKLVISGSGE